MYVAILKFQSMISCINSVMVDNITVHKIYRNYAAIAKRAWAMCKLWLDKDAYHPFDLCMQYCRSIK